MMRHWFKTPVSIWAGGLGVKRNVTSAEEAARLLLEEWPPGDTLEAQKALLEAMEGGSIDRAEAEFKMAASKAGILA